jgi:predicted porin
LVAVGVLGATELANAQTVKLGVGGYMRQEFGFSFDRGDGNGTGGTNGGANDVSGAGTNTATGFDQQSDVEVHFRGSGKLDNGIEVLAVAELEIAGSPGNMIDEHFLVMRGSFGQFEMGAMDSAAIKTTIGYMGSWATQVGENSTFGPSDWIAIVGGVMPPGSGTMDSAIRNMQLRMFDDDGNKISYFTPRFEGFQVGVSYTPNATQNTQTGTGAAEARAKQSVYHNYLSVGGNFDRKFGDVGVGIAAGYVTAKSPGTNSTETATTWKNTDDAVTWGIGASVEWGPFKISGGYRENTDVRDTSGASTGTSLDGTLFDIGGRYTFGPNAVSLTYRDGTEDGTKTLTTEDKEQMFMASYRRTLGPGVNWDANLFYLKSENEGTTEATAAGLSENSGWAFTTAIQLAF